MGNLVFLNDALVEAGCERARIDPSDAGLLHGMGLFETLRVYHGKAFRLDRHVARLLASADKLELPLRHKARQITAAARRVIEANGWADARLRITVTRGPTGADLDRPQSTLLVAGSAEVGYPAELYEKGMAVAIAAPRVNQTDPTAGHKTLNYWPRLAALQAARARRCGEALWFTLDAKLSEACISNVFLARQGKLVTPPADTPVLPGITRAAVLEVAAADKIETQEAPIMAPELLKADEVFLCNSIMEIMPVVLIERQAIGDGRPGPMTKAICRLYRELVERETRG